MGSSLTSSLGTLGEMLTHSPYFFAIYASIATTPSPLPPTGSS